MTAVDVRAVMQRSLNSANVNAARFPQSQVLTNHAKECAEALTVVTELVEANRWRDPASETPEIGQAVLVAYKRGRHTVVGSATYWDYKKGVHDDDSGPQWQFDAHDFIESVLAWKPMATYPDAALARAGGAA